MAVVFAFAVPMRASAVSYVTLDAQAQRWLNRAIQWLATITFAAYAVWIGAALLRGLRIDTILALLKGDAGTMYVLRYQYFETLGGVTTWMQLGALVVPLAILRSKSGGRSAKPLVGSLIFLALVRALLNSERLALIEVVVSALLAILILRDRAPAVTRNLFSALAIILGSWATLYLLFALFEYFRSWTSAQDSFNGDFWAYTSGLLLGYYATALNLAAFDLGILDGRELPSAVFDGNIYEQLLGVSPIAGAQKFYGLETFTNRSGLIVPYTAAGLFGGVALILCLGLVIAWLARRSARGDLVAFAVYCASAVGILEIVRIFYFGSSRFLPIIIAALALSVFWALDRSHSTKRSDPSFPTSATSRK
jgi:hypothetical protein